MKSLQLDKPHAIIVVGIQGSGKSFFAEKFADTFHAPYVNQSEVEKYTNDQTLTQNVVELMLKELLKTKKSVILEIESNSKVKRAELAMKLRKAGYVPLLVWVQTDVETARYRSQKNNGVGPDQHQKNVQRFTAPSSQERALVISGKHTYATQARIVLKKISHPRGEASSAPQRPSTPTRGQIIIR